jgi:hypothetical protein
MPLPVPVPRPVDQLTLADAQNEVTRLRRQVHKMWGTNTLVHQQLTAQKHRADLTEKILAQTQADYDTVEAEAATLRLEKQRSTAATQMRAAA